MILVTNAAPQPCKLEGFPVLSLEDSKQRPVPVTFDQNPGELVAPHLPHKVEPVTIDEGDTADFGFDFTDSQITAASDCVSPRYLFVQLPGQDESNTVDIGDGVLICGLSPHPEVTLSPMGAITGT